MLLFFTDSEWAVPRGYDGEGFFSPLGTGWGVSGLQGAAQPCSGAGRQQLPALPWHLLVKEFLQLSVGWRILAISPCSSLPSSGSVRARLLGGFLCRHPFSFTWQTLARLKEVVVEKLGLSGPEVSEADVCAKNVQSGSPLNPSLGQVGWGGLGKMPCGKGILMLNSPLCPLAEASGMGVWESHHKEKTPWELLLEDVRSVWSCRAGAAHLLPSDGGSRAAAEAVGDGGSRWASPRKSKVLPRGLPDPLRLGVSGKVEGWGWLSASPRLPNPRHELKKWSTSPTCRWARSWDPRGSWTGGSFQPERREQGPGVGGAYLGGGWQVLRCKCGSEIEKIRSLGTSAHAETLLSLRQRLF